MIIKVYFKDIKERLLLDNLVNLFEIVRERTTMSDGYLRARLELTNAHRLEFSEYVQLTSRNKIEIVTYSYQWMDADNQLIQRWDNAPHFPNLTNFPHHIHIGSTKEVKPGQPIDIFGVLQQINQAIQPHEQP